MIQFPGPVDRVEIGLFGPGQNPVSFGADPGGNGDSTQAIQAACNAIAPTGGRVYIPKGTYKISATITVPDNVQIVGEGTIIAAAQSVGTTGGLLLNMGNNGVVRGITLDGNQANQPSQGLFGTLQTKPSTSGTQFLNVIVQNTPNYGILLRSGGTGHLVMGCTVKNIATSFTGKTDGTSSGISIQGCSQCRIVGNTVNTTNGCGINCITSPSSALVIDGNLVLSPFFIGIGLGTGASNCTIAGNQVILPSGTTTGDAIDIGTVTGCNVTGNLCQFGGIANGGPSFQCSITGNTIIGALVGGIFFGGAVSSPVDSVIANNMIYKSGHDGIVTDSVINLTISGNVVMDSSQASSGTYGGIAIANTAATPTDILITGNRCGDDQASKTQAYAVRNIATAWANINIVCNDFTGNLTGVLGPTAAPVGGGTHGGNQGYDVPGSFASY